MGIIAFIRAFAFISSIIARIIVIPFVIIGKLIRACWHGTKKLLLFCVQNARNNRKKRQDENLKKHERREARRVIKEDKHKIKLEKKRKKQEEHRKRIEEKHNRLKKERSKENKGRLKISETDSRVTIVFKNICLFVLKVGYKIQYALYWITQKSYWIARGLLQKIYWKMHSIFRKVYWVTRGICQKIYWKVYSMHSRSYWRIRNLWQRIYWKIYSIYQKIYWRIRGIYQRLYWFYYAQSRKFYAFLSKNEYMDLFLIFFREYAKHEKHAMKYVKICGVKEFVMTHKQATEYKLIEEGKIRVVCIPEYFEKNGEKIEKFNSPDIYMAEISNVCLIGGSNVIIADNTLLNDAAFYDKENRLDIRYSAIKKIIHGIAVIEDFPEPEMIPRGINLVGAASFNYYHLVVEILSRLTFIDYYEKYREYPILVDEIVLKIPQFAAALECINKFKHPVIKIDKDKKYVITSLVVPSPNVWMPTNVYNRDSIRVSDFLIADSVLNNIRKDVCVWEAEKPWRKIFISRKNTKALRLQNEEDVRLIFDKEGFEIVYTEEMTFRQQVECFGQAKCVIATSGAALTNTIFCQPGTLVGCIIPSEHRFYMYSTIAYILGLKPIFLDAEITEKTPYAAADMFTLDEEYVKRYIQYIQKN